MVRASLEIGNSNQELMEKSGSKKLKSWLLGTVIVALVIALIISGIIIFSRAQADNGDIVPVANAITMDDIAEGNISPLRFNGSWISDDEILYVDSEGNLAIQNVLMKTKNIIVSNENKLLPSSIDQILSADRKFVLFTINYRKLYRHSYSAQNVAFELATGQQYLISATTTNTYLEFVLWSPVGNAIAFVQNNDVYYKPSVDGAPIKLTSTGVPGIIYNGVPDWVYEEEIFSSNKALWFSPDGSHLAFGSFNDTDTHVMTIPFYGAVGDPESQYPKTLPVRYPKAGTANPTVNVYLAKLTSQPVDLRVLPIPPNLKEPILNTVSFANGSTVSVTWTNRVQNESKTLFCEFAQQGCREVFSYDEPRGWVEMLHPSVFNSDGSFFFRILPKSMGSDAFRQVAMFTNNGSYEFLTSGNSTVTELLHWDEVRKRLWYVATSEEDSAFQHIYYVTLNREVKCFTCNVMHSSGTQCLYNEAAISKNGSHVIVSCLGPQIPEVYIYEREGKKLHDLELNSELSEFLSNKAVPAVRRYTVQIASGSLPPAQVLLLTPPNADLSGATKYPLLVNVYGGPDAYQVLEKWQIGWGETLVSRWNVILAMIDGRGSGLKGNNNLFSIYRNLGSYEINDQINVTRHLQRTLGYIDAERSCIWGWSYGGYAAALALARGGNTFKCAISVAPVTDWQYYDSIYTERYMGLPNQEDNAKGYNESKLATTENALALGKKKFMLVHGTLDDNVHYQQSMALSRLLQLEDVLFTQMTYPDEDHGLFAVKSHLYHTIEQFLKPIFFKISPSSK